YVRYIALKMAHAGDAHAVRREQNVAAAAEHAREGALAQRQLLELRGPPVARRADQIARAVPHQRHGAVPQRRAHDLIDMLLLLQPDELEFDMRVARQESILARLHGERERDPLRLPVIVEKRATKPTLRCAPDLRAQHLR